MRINVQISFNVITRAQLWNTQLRAESFSDLFFTEEANAHPFRAYDKSKIYLVNNPTGQKFTFPLNLLKSSVWLRALPSKLTNNEPNPAMFFCQKNVGG